MSKQNCAHCGRPVYGEGYGTRDDHPFCCKGCLDAYLAEKEEEIDNGAVAVGWVVGVAVAFLNPVAGVVVGLATRVAIPIFNHP